MSVITDIRKTIDTDSAKTPFFAVVGATDLAVEKAREASLRAQATRAQLAADLEPAKLQTTVVERATKLADQAQSVPALALNRSLEIADRAQQSYEALAVRGENLIKRLRTQKSTQDLVAQAEATLALGKGAVTSARKGVAEIERSTKALVTTGRNEIARTADVVADSVADEAAIAAAEVKKSAARTRTAAKRTSTTTKKSATRATTSAKAVTTSARKTAAAGTKATKKAASKVGD